MKKLILGMLLVVSSMGIVNAKEVKNKGVNEDGFSAGLIYSRLAISREVGAKTDSGSLNMSGIVINYQKDNTIFSLTKTNGTNSTGEDKYSMSEISGKQILNDSGFFVGGSLSNLNLDAKVPAGWSSWNWTTNIISLDIGQIKKVGNFNFDAGFKLGLSASGSGTTTNILGTSVEGKITKASQFYLNLSYRF